MLFTFTDNAFEIGFLTKSRLKKLYQDGDISEHQMNTFYKAASARRFFERAFRYALDSLPHHATHMSCYSMHSVLIGK